MDRKSGWKQMQKMTVMGRYFYWTAPFDRPRQVGGGPKKSFQNPISDDKFKHTSARIRD